MLQSAQLCEFHVVIVKFYDSVELVSRRRDYKQRHATRGVRRSGKVAEATAWQAVRRQSPVRVDDLPRISPGPGR